MSPPRDELHRCTLIYLHGFQGEGSGYFDPENELDFPWRAGDNYAPGLRVLMPTAPELIMPWGEWTNAWYTYRNEQSNDIGDACTLEATRKFLSTIVHAEVERCGGDGSRVFLGGVSQGCSAALDTYLRLAPQLRLGGFVGSIGLFPDESLGFGGAAAAFQRLVADRPQAARPVWIQCATDDYETVPWDLVRRTLKPIKGRLPGLEVRNVSGRGHDVWDWEIRMLNKFLRKYASGAYSDVTRPGSRVLRRPVAAALAA